MNFKDTVRSLANSLGYDIVQKRNSNTNIDDHLANIFLAKNIDCVIDVGANSGQYAQSLRKLGFKITTEPCGAFYVYADCSGLADESFDLCQELLTEAGVAATPGLDFGSNAPQRHIRFAYTVDRSRIEEGLARMAKYLSGRP